MVSLLQAFKLCTNLRSFTSTSNVLPTLLVPLKNLENLEALRVRANLTSEPTQLLVACSKLKSLALDACSWNVVDALPQWGSRLGRTLTSLTLHVSVCLGRSTPLLTIVVEYPRSQRHHIVRIATYPPGLAPVARRGLPEDRARIDIGSSAICSSSRISFVHMLGMFYYSPRHESAGFMSISLGLAGYTSRYTTSPSATPFDDRHAYTPGYCPRALTRSMALHDCYHTVMGVSPCLYQPAHV